MAISEAQRADLYTGLAEVLGPRRAELLMSQLPRFDPDEVATKSDVAPWKTDMAGLKTDMAAVRGDVAVLKTDVAELKTEMAAVKGDLVEFKSDLKTGLAAVNQRLDRLFLALLAGSFGIVISLIGLIISVS